MMTTTLAAWMTTLRHQLHAHPELALQEVATTALIKQTLTELNIRLVDYPGETGVVAEIGHGAPIIALRADIDALPIQEANELSFKSTIPGRMHACGHDFHTAALLGGARLLKVHEADLNGTVRLIFQPAEEGHRGAKMMIDNGVLAGVRAIAGFHNMPNLPVGTLAMKSGPLMASNDNFDVTILGQGAHAAMPEASHDPIVTLGELISNLQTIRSRNIAPDAALVLTIAAVQAGTTFNVIPNTANLRGTIRTFNTANRDLAKVRFYDIVRATAKMNQQTATIDWDRGPSCVNNNAALTAVLSRVLKDDFDIVPAQLCNADDDFALYQECIPGFYGFLGSGGNGTLHQSNYRCDDAGLTYGARFHELAATALLKWVRA
ncbi:amidohydrolase [Lactiplantibacillus plantarum]|uniref:amidohydrolase n=1 Tax=Lactiplantibacillus plantarum TaxID=1590 RepID=UPI0007B55FEB|nr:amidohydrolase [Lactiplantibacillus plantarum]KZT81014.1 N-acetyl-L L-diaminopimelate deacetylase-like protein [Lactiplantibacillus plantarum]KZT86005.1 N-acetyl-L L-diaminopimelate deacetylase-like protein [Lactiplantibacillus plantarum]KZU45844.1 N-acetyl-L L-diaminopimelate deacetylase-like protein [Lactiplantibacillus plantarum]KZU47567.1 N-acetyl-L L-diaminopimelate deacetylase-like protein [Lactiplantibacillus plantarum]MCG0586136.1 aminohydrolase [Lactiplantibacillus plantarum]